MGVLRWDSGGGGWGPWGPIKWRWLQRWRIGGSYEVAVVLAVGELGASCQMSVRMGSAFELTPFLIG